MKAKLIGMSAYQGTPTSGTLRIYRAGRYEDGQGNAAVRLEEFKWRAGTAGARGTWGDPFNPAVDAYTVVSAAGEPAPVEGLFEEVFAYADGSERRSLYRKNLIATNLTGTEFDYTQPQGVTTYSGSEPITFQAARDLLTAGNTKIQEVDAAILEWADTKVDIAQTTEEMRTVAGTYNVGRMPTAGDPAGVYRVVLPDGSVVDAPWDGEALGTPSPALATLSEIADALTGAESRLDGVIQGAEAQVQGVVTLADAKIQETSQALQALQGVANVIKGLRVENPVSHLDGQLYDFVLDTQAVTTATVFPADNGGLLYDLIGGPQ